MSLIGLQSELVVVGQCILTSVSLLNQGDSRTHPSHYSTAVHWAYDTSDNCLRSSVTQEWIFVPILPLICFFL